MIEPETALGPDVSRGRARLLLALLVLAALALRVTGIEWGLSTNDHFATYRADEWRAVVMGMDLELLQGEVTPSRDDKVYFNWGTLHLYEIAAACKAADFAGWIDMEGNQYAWTLESLRRGTLLARLVTVSHGVGLVLALYVLASRAFDRRTGLLAAAIMALTPLEVMESHFAFVNVTTSFWTVVALGMILRAADLSTPRAFAFAGASAGFAIASKLSALPLLPLGALALVWASLRRDRPGAFLARARRASAAALLGLALGFSVACPAALLHPLEFLGQAHEQLIVMPSQGSGLAFAGTGNGFAFLFGTNLPVVLGWPLFALCMAGLAWAAWTTARTLGSGDRAAPSRAQLAVALLFLYALLVIVPLGLSETRFVRYLLGLSPLLYVFGARATVLAPRWGGLRSLLVAAVLGYSALYSLACVQTLRRTDPRDAALSWFQEHVPDRASVGFLTWPNHFFPPVHPFSRPYRQRVLLRRAERGYTERRISFHVLNMDPQELLDLSPDYVVDSPKGFSSYVRVGEPRVLECLAVLERDYIDAGGPWRNEITLFGLHFDKGPDAMRGWAPASTEVRILVRRDLVEEGEVEPSAW